MEYLVYGSSSISGTVDDRYGNREEYPVQLPVTQHITQQLNGLAGGIRYRTNARILGKLVCAGKPVDIPDLSDQDSGYTNMINSGPYSSTYIYAGTVGTFNTGYKSTNEINSIVKTLNTGMGNHTYIGAGGYVSNAYGSGSLIYDPMELYALEFGEDSPTYQMLATLDNLYKGIQFQTLEQYLSLKKDYLDKATKIKQIARASEKYYTLDSIPTFEIDHNQGIYYSPKYPLQKIFGYSDFYDFVFDTACDIDTIKMDFSNRGQDWRIQFWKANYNSGLVNMGLGGEMGIYTKSNILGFMGGYSSASDENFMPMSFALYSWRDTPVFMRSDSSHWWLNGFSPMRYAPSDEARMIGSITLQNSDMVDSFTSMLPGKVRYTVNGLRVDYDWK